MPYRGIQLTPKPTSEQPGDIFPIDLSSGTVIQIRGSSVLQTWSVSFPGVLLGDVPPTQESSAIFRWLVYWEERKVPGTTLSITNIRRGTSEQVYVDFSNGDQLVFETLADMAAVADEVDANVSIAQKILIMKALRESPDGANLGAAIGSQVSINGSAGVTEPVVYTAAQ